MIIVAAMDDNMLIGDGDRLPWDVPGDLAHFRWLTIGHTVIMGRKTYESIGKALPGRRNIVLTRNVNYVAPDCSVINELTPRLYKRAFLIGGAEIYREYMTWVTEMHITHIHGVYEGDTYFPKIDMRQWEGVSKQEHDGYTIMHIRRI